MPASTLPVDPTGLSYEAGEQTVDPRDQLTPGLMRITNGEDILEDLTGLSDDQQHGIFNNMLLDPRWYKWMLQTGVKRYATPRYWTIGQLHQDKWPGAIMNYPLVTSEGAVRGTGEYGQRLIYGQEGISGTTVEGSSSYGFFQTGHRGVLGWLPTDDLQPIYGESGLKPLLASPPEVEVMKIILPKAYKTKYYYRMFITETVYFKDPIVNLGISYNNGVTDYCYRPLDVFHGITAPSPMSPISPQSSSFPTDSSTGGNYGDD